MSRTFLWASNLLACRFGVYEIKPFEGSYKAYLGSTPTVYVGTVDEVKASVEEFLIWADEQKANR